MTETLTPSEVIQFRAECYRNLDGKGVFSLYSERSDLCRFFSEESFSEHFSKQTAGCTHAGVKIVNEQEKGGLAEVKYIEYIHEGTSLVSYYSKTALVTEDGQWKILRESREVRKNAITA